MINDNIAKIRSRIDGACRECGRDPLSVALIAVTKGHSARDILQILESGVLFIGENKVQEVLSKFQAVGASKYSGQVKWHMIGHLQTNKVRDAVRMFDLIHSVDSFKLASAIDKESAKIGKVQDILIEVKTSHEESKFGVRPADLGVLVQEISGLSHLKLKGLMTMAPSGGYPSAAVPYFSELKKMFDFVNGSLGRDRKMSELSMGMSGDFEEAVKCGATMVRIGRALFEG